MIPILTPELKASAVGWLLAALLAWTALVGFAGWLTGYDYRGDLAERDAATLRAAQTDALAKAQADAAARYRAATERGVKAEADLLTARAQFDAERRTQQSRITHVTTRYVPVPGAASIPLPACVFTRGWLHDYNAALGLPEGGSAAVAGESGDTAGGAASADAGLLPAAGLSQADILAHAGDYGAWCRGLAAQVDRLVELRRAEQ